MTEDMANLICECVRFSLWAAGQGISPVKGEPAGKPETFFFEYCLRTGCEDWDALPEAVRLALTSNQRGGE